MVKNDEFISIIFGSGRGMRFGGRWRRKKVFVEELKEISASSFPYKVMQTLPESGVEIDVRGVKTRVLPSHMEIRQGAGLRCNDYAANRLVIGVLFTFSLFLSRTFFPSYRINVANDFYCR